MPQYNRDMMHCAQDQRKEKRPMLLLLAWPGNNK